MTGKVGDVWWDGRLNDDTLRADLNRTTEELRRTGKVGGDALGQGMTQGAKAGAASVDAEAQKAGKATERHLGGAAGKVKEGFSGAHKALAAIGVTVGLATVVSFLGSAVEAASDLNETASKTAVILGDESMPALEKWAEGAADAFGQSKRGALDAASTFAQFGKNAGLAGDDLANFSMDLTELASDLASFHNADPSEVVQAMGAAFRGESEPMQRFGVDTRDAALKVVALREGIIATTKEALTPQQRVLAVQAQMWAETADEQGDYARTSEGLANVQRSLKADMENLSAEIGEELLPLMVQFGQWVRADGIPALEALLIAFQNLGNEDSAADIPVIGQIEDILNGVSDAALEANDVITGKFHSIATAADDLGLSYIDMRERIREVMEQTGVDHETAVQMIRNGFGMMTEAQWDAVEQSGLAWGAYQAQIDGIPDATAAGMEGTADAIAGPVEEGTDRAVADIDNMYAEIAQVMSDREEQLREAGGNAIDAWYDPQLAAIEHQQAIADLEAAEAALLEAQRIGTDAEILEAERRVLELRAKNDQIALDLALSGTNQEQIQKLNGLLNSEAYLAGINSNDAEVRNYWVAYGEEVREHMQQLGADMTPAGANVSGSLDRGLESKRPAIRTTTDGIAGDVRARLNFSAYSGGWSVAQTWLSGMTSYYWANRRLTIDAIADDAKNRFGRSLPRSGPLAGGVAPGGASVMGSWFDGALGAYRSRVGELNAAMSAVGSLFTGRAGLASPSMGIAESMAVSRSLATAGSGLLAGSGVLPGTGGLAGGMGGAAGAAGQTVINDQRQVHLHAEGRTPPIDTEADLARLYGRVGWEW